MLDMGLGPLKCNAVNHNFMGEGRATSDMARPAPIPTNESAGKQAVGVV